MGCSMPATSEPRILLRRQTQKKTRRARMWPRRRQKTRLARSPPRTQVVTHRPVVLRIRTSPKRLRWTLVRRWTRLPSWAAKIASRAYPRIVRAATWSSNACASRFASGRSNAPKVASKTAGLPPLAASIAWGPPTAAPARSRRVSFWLAEVAAHAPRRALAPCTSLVRLAIRSFRENRGPVVLGESGGADSGGIARVASRGASAPMNRRVQPGSAKPSESGTFVPAGCTSWPYVVPGQSRASRTSHVSRPSMKS
jgi:hypothetical protein